MPSAFGEAEAEPLELVVLANDAQGCSAAGTEGAAAAAGRPFAAVMNRGTCNFARKATTAQSAGAGVAVIADNPVSSRPLDRPAEQPPTLGAAPGADRDSVTVPVVAIHGSDGIVLQAAAALLGWPPPTLRVFVARVGELDAEQCDNSPASRSIEEEVAARQRFESLNPLLSAVTLRQALDRYDWRGVERLQRVLRLGVEEFPAARLCTSLDPALGLVERDVWESCWLRSSELLDFSGKQVAYAPRSPSSVLPSLARGRRRPRVAVISASLHNGHPLALTSVGPFEANHAATGRNGSSLPTDGRRVDLYCYFAEPMWHKGGASGAERTSEQSTEANATRLRIERGCVGMRTFALPLREPDGSVRPATVAAWRAIADEIASDDVDVLIDFDGFTATTVFGVLAMRPAPTIVTYLGHPSRVYGAPGVLSHATVDRRLWSPELEATLKDTDSTERLESESLLILPVSYYPADPSLVHHSTQPTESTSFTFLSLARPSKVSQSTFVLWCAILRRSPRSSQLWLARPTDAMATNNLVATAAAHGVHSSRLVFLDRVPSREDYLHRMLRADLHLDTLEYNAGSVGVESLSIGLPLLTLQGGGSVASRMAASAVSAAGTPELVALSEREYEDAAVRLAWASGVITSQIRDRLRGTNDLRNATARLDDLVRGAAAAAEATAACGAPFSGRPHVVVGAP